MVKYFMKGKCNVVSSNMAAKWRLTVITKENAFAPSISCSFLYGQVGLDRNGDKILYIEDVVPIDENNVCNRTPNKYARVTECNSRNSKYLVRGLVCNKSRLDYERLFEILKQEAKSTLFSVLVVAIDEIFKGKSFVLLHSEYYEETPFEFCNIENMPRTELRIVCINQGLHRSQLSWLYSMDSDKTTGRSGKQPKYISNRFQRDQSHATNNHSFGRKDININNSSSGFLSLLFLSVPSILSMVCPGLKLATIFKQFLGHSTKYLFVAKQLSYRLDQLYDVCIDRQDSQKQADVGSKSIVNGNLFISLFIDIILGFFVIYFVFSNQHCLSISSWLIGQKYNVAEHLSSLLKWLMGAPAGLKLNIPLNQFLGNFYIYHVYLWTNYLYFIEAYLPTIILCCTLAGCFGVTFLLSLLCDVLSLLTVHIYCFYIYAARLFCLEINVLASLLRLFTGKKWNILRSRVDSVEYDVDRLFIGTLLFTILLFLFPTVCLYYIVFTSLRLLVLLVQSCLYGLVALLNSFPSYGLWLYFMNSERLPGKIIVHTKDITRSSGLDDCDATIENVTIIKPDSCLFLSFRHKCLPCGSLFRNCTSAVLETTFQDIFGEGIFKKLLTGKIISKP